VAAVCRSRGRRCDDEHNLKEEYGYAYDDDIDDRALEASVVVSLICTFFMAFLLPAVNVRAHEIGKTCSRWGVSLSLSPSNPPSPKPKPSLTGVDKNSLLLTHTHNLTQTMEEGPLTRPGDKATSILLALEKKISPSYSPHRTAGDCAPRAHD
jgi:hypothetical protein